MDSLPEMLVAVAGIVLAGPACIAFLVHFFPNWSVAGYDASKPKRFKIFGKES